MEHEQFSQIISETLDKAEKMLTRKSEGYSTADDRLHNFRVASALNGLTMEQVCWGMLTKHIISLRDMVMSDEDYEEDIWDEKLGDAINYLAILKAITLEGTVNERAASNKVLANLKESLSGHNHNTAPSQIESDISSIKRVADKHNY